MEFKNKAELQRYFEMKYAKNHLITRIKKELTGNEAAFKQACSQANLPYLFTKDLLAQLVLRKRANLATLVGILRHHFNDNCQHTADAITVAAYADFIDYNSIGDVFITKITMTPEVQEELDAFQYPVPFVIKPKTVTNNNQTGYYTINGSIILKDNHHLDDVCLDHINKVNSYALTLNTDVAFMIKNKWKNLDKRKVGESNKDYQQRKNAFAKYDKSSKNIIQLLVDSGNKFYLSHRPDKRGRIYSMGYHVNYQGSDWNKAVIEFYHKEHLN